MIEIDLIKFGSYLRGKKYLILLWVIIATSLSVIYCLYAEKNYLTQVTLVPSSLGIDQPNSPVNIPGFSSFLNPPTSSPTEDLLASIIKSRTFISSIANKSLTGMHDSSWTVKSFYGFDSLFNENIPSYIETVKKNIHFEKVKKGDGNRDFEYLLSIYGNDPYYIFNFANFLVPFLDSTWMAYFNEKLDRDINQVNKKLMHAQNTLSVAESTLIRFRKTNSGVGTSMSSPELEMKFQQLMRDVKVLETKFLMTYDKLQSLELEKLSVAPKMMILDSAYISPHHVFPKRKLIVSSTFVLSLLFICGLYFILFVLKQYRASAE